MFSIKKNLTLAFALVIPLLMIVSIIGIIYIPGLFTQPHYNFLYVTNNTYYGTPQYSVSNGKIIKNIISSEDQVVNHWCMQKDMQIYLYDINTQSAKNISLEEAQRLTLDPSETSPDGFVIKSNGDYNSSPLPFFGGGSNSKDFYLRGHGVTKKLHISLDNYCYNNLPFLGWIIEPK
jgi:hypothetical protein